MGESVPGILKGGPHGGRVIHVDPGHPDIVTPYVPHLPPVMIEAPKRPWWKRILRRPDPWFPPDPSAFKNALYRLSGETSGGGMLVYRYEGDQ